TDYRDFQTSNFYTKDFIVNSDALLHQFMLHGRRRTVIYILCTFGIAGRQLHDCVKDDRHARKTAPVLSVNEFSHFSSRLAKSGWAAQKEIIAVQSRRFGFLKNKGHHFMTFFLQFISNGLAYTLSTAINAVDYN